jgi:hypothetical protein
MTQLNICIFKALDQIKLINQELEILEFKEKLQKDEKTK